jgi:hypothetical protein
MANLIRRTDFSMGRPNFGSCMETFEGKLKRHNVAMQSLRNNRVYCSFSKVLGEQVMYMLKVITCRKLREN